MKSETPYLQWRSDLSLEQVFSPTQSFCYPTPYGDGVLYLTAIASEKQRQALVLLDEQGEHHRLTPAPFHLNTKINEYGGKPFWLHDNEIVFANRSDQCLYRQLLDGTVASAPQVITKDHSDGVQMYAEVHRLAEDFYIAIVEQEQQTQENSCCIATINCVEGAACPVKVESGADFYNNLVVDCEQRRIAWVEWNHPAMPWDDNQLWIAEYTLLNGQLELHNKRSVQLASAARFCQLCFAENGRLFFCADRQHFSHDQAENFWNIYLVEPNSQQLAVKQVTAQQLEFGYPHWQFGDARLIHFDSQYLLAQATGIEGDSLYRIDQETLEYSVLQQTGGCYQTLSGNKQGVVALLEQGAIEAAKLLRMDATGMQCLISGERFLPERDISIAQHLEYPSASSVPGSSFGYYYKPCNHAYQNAGPPPLLVMVHGGPTGRASPNYDLQKQFWTNRGFAVLDVNHRGSIGYGRNYRDALLGRWGQLDTSDIVDGINYLIEHQLAHPQQICIRGKSAGGYAVLRVLTEFPDIFRAGACYYGIGNLATLAEITHKFEKNYTDRLINERYDAKLAQSPNSEYQRRSPINNIANIKSAMIIFQGAQDNVVPPQLAHEMVEALQAYNIPHRYIEYPEEGHGFRQIENNIDAWNNELDFYREVLADG